jgi:hypothetical protein
MPKSKSRQRNASATERRLLGVPKGSRLKVEDIDLEDPNLAPEHRDNFITAIKVEVARLDELIGSWYRHRAECGDPDCDCGGNELIERAKMMCGHVLAIKMLFGLAIIDDYAQFARLVREFGGTAAHRQLAAEKQPS